jgi:dipeptide/tripeptide permease
LIIIAVYATFSIFQSDNAKSKITSGAIATAVLAFLVYRAMGIEATKEIAVAAPIFQQFNPFYVVALTPVSMAIFGSLARKGKEPSAPRKIAYGMLVAAIGFVIMAVGSNGLNTPNEQQRAIAVDKAETFAKEYYTIAPTAEALETMKEDATYGATVKPATDFMGKLTKNTKPIFFEAYNAQSIISAADDTAAVEAATTTLDAIKSETKPETRTSAYWLIITYLILTFAELLLSPMGISFVSKVAPPKLKGLMMGGWFVATAFGNMLVSVGGFLWAGLPLWSVWTVFIVLCLISALFMFAMMKRLESVTK